MSSKDPKGSSDALQTKTKKKDKTKKESKKEKKEKNKKRDSKDLESDSVNNNSAEIEEGGQDDSSPKSKKFGIFRLSGRKSKSEKRNSKHGSSDSLKRQSVDSSDFDIRGSENSLVESTGSSEVTTTITEMSTTTTEVSSTATEEPTTSVQVSTTKVEKSTTRAKLDGIETADPQGTSVVETSSKVTIVSTGQHDLEKDKDTEAGTEQPAEKDAKQEGLNEKMANEALEVEPEVQKFEFKLQSSVISSEVKMSAEGNEEQRHEATEENEVSLEEVKAEKDREIPSSEDDSVDTVVSAETNKGLKEINEENETENTSGVEELIISTYYEKEGPLQSAVQELPPIDEDAIVLSYESKTQEERKGDQHVQEEPITLASKESKREVVMDEITFQEEPTTEAEPVLLIESEKTMKIEKIHGRERKEEPSKEELLIPTIVQRKGGATEGEEQEQQEAPLNEEAMALSYPEKEDDQLQNESQDGPMVDEEEQVEQVNNEKKGNQIEEQIEEFLKLDAKNEERTTEEGETVKKHEEVEKIATRDTPKKSKPPERKEVKVESSENAKRESTPFDEKSTFIKSTPKRTPIYTEQGKRADAENENRELTPAYSYNIIPYRGGSVVTYHLKVEIVNNIRDVKMSTKLLLAQLAENNKRLRMLQKELLEVQKGDGNEEPTNTTQVSVET